MKYCDFVRYWKKIKNNRGGGDISIKIISSVVFLRQITYLKALTDTDPHAAIKAARMLKVDDLLNQNNIDALAAGTLIDAGTAAGDFTAVEEGVVILKDSFHERNDIQYCLANGLSSKADFDTTACILSDILAPQIFVKGRTALPICLLKLFDSIKY